ncbi:uncharacterized protein LOC111712700 [Eurytemora carolleeae]|uniref:uncharacterized protein LOC111712700 n=1 Tax=Eurytemora carolleeae TaxID=1294199 RepID=UPI000C77791F|nr:uncharacterized protein LOC111712700 [Eurytemora carolleeae]|eukprot:XP_023343158.1 uncharacterized protein LOC111712700 [Eurytemora affinis]
MYICKGARLNDTKDMKIFVNPETYLNNKHLLLNNDLYILERENKIHRISKFQSVVDDVVFKKELQLIHGKNMSRDMMGLKLRIGYLPASTYLQYSGTRFTGSLGEIFENLRTRLNFTYDAVLSVDGFYGSRVKEGVRIGGRKSHYNGLIGMIEREEIDIALTDIALTADRNQVASFGGTMLLQPTVLIVAKPGTDYQIDAYFIPLKTVYPNSN